MSVCYVILTCQAFIKTRCEWQNNTFLKDVDPKDVYFLSAVPEEPNIYGWNTQDDYASCPMKYIKFFKNMYVDYDWYVFIDDDTFINTFRLLPLLATYNANELYYIGQPGTEHGITFMSGGAGFCISRPLYKKLIDHVRNKSDSELRYIVYGDATLGSWITHVPDVKYETNYKFYSETHKNEKQLQENVSFHYLKKREHFDYYYSMAKNLDLSLPFPN